MTLHDLAKQVCARYHTNIAELKGPCRLQHLVNARKELTKLAMTGPLFRRQATVARFLNKDKSTVWYYVKSLINES